MTPKNMFVSLLGLALLIFIGTGFMFTFAQNQFDDALDTIAIKKAEIEIADSEYEQLVQVEQQLEDFDVELEPFLPGSKSQSEALELVFDIFRDANINIDSYNFNPTEGLPGETSQSQPSVAGNVLSLPLQLSPDNGNTNYQDFMKLLKGLEQAQRQLSINRLAVTSVPVEAENPEGPRKLDLTLDVSVQYLKQGAPSAQ